MRIWLDDIREMPKGYDKWCTTAWELNELVRAGKVTHISFDHDLAHYGTGYDVAVLIERLAHEGVISRITWEIHSANPVGRKNIMAALKSAEKAWDALEIS